MRQQTKVLVISLLVTLTILMSSFFAIQWWFVTKPVQTILDQQTGIHATELNVKPTEVRLRLQIDATYDFIAKYPHLLAELERIAGYRDLAVTLDQGRSPEAEQAWDELQFALNESIATQRYTLIPEAVRSVSQKHQLTYDVKMDDRFVYVQLEKKGQTLRHVVPIKTETLSKAEQSDGKRGG